MMANDGSWPIGDSASSLRHPFERGQLAPQLVSPKRSIFPNRYGLKLSINRDTLQTDAFLYIYNLKKGQAMFSLLASFRFAIGGTIQLSTPPRFSDRQSADSKNQQAKLHRRCQAPTPSPNSLARCGRLEPTSSAPTWVPHLGSMPWWKAGDLGHGRLGAAACHRLGLPLLSGSMVDCIVRSSAQRKVTGEAASDSWFWERLWLSVAAQVGIARILNFSTATEVLQGKAWI